MIPPKEKTKHAGGRPPKFKTPDELEKLAEEYFAWCEANPIKIYKRKDASARQAAKNGSSAGSAENEMYITRPYTLDGFCLWSNIGDWTSFKSSAAYQSDEFRGVIYAIEQTIRDQQVSGAMVGMYNSNLTARLNGIADTTKTEATVKAEVKNEDKDFDLLPDDVKDEIVQKIQDAKHKRYMEQHYGKENDK